MTDRYIPSVPCWVDTTQPDPAAAAQFYGALFGWQLENVAPDGEPAYLVAQLNGGDVAAIMPPAEGAPPAATWNTYIWVESADATAEMVRAAGGAVIAEPFDVSDAGRMAVCADPQGAAFCLWQPDKHRGATVVNEPGSLNFNDLNTHDVVGAKAFYGAVFGWETIDLGGGSEMWSLPAYGDFLEQRNPGMRAGMEEMGAPAGFETVVASLTEIPGDQPAHWGVTFAVADADETARRAGELGASIVMEPFDAPWVRVTVITDPQGATFTAAKFVPENKDVAAGAAAA